MSYCVEKLPHTCGSSDALQVFRNKDGSFSGYCFSCGKYVPNPYSDKPEGYSPSIKEKSEEDKKREMEEALSLPVLALDHRGINQEATEYFQIRTALSEEDGVTPVAFFFPYEKDGNLCGFKVKFRDKKMYALGSIKDADPFGWRQAMNSGRKKLFITEGEEDSAATFQILKEASKPEFRHIDPAVISLPHGASSAVHCLTPRLKQLRDTFEEVVLVFDMDEQGIKARKDVQRLAPWIKHVELPCKDANDCLKEGRIKVTANMLVFANREAEKNTRLINGRDLLAEAMEPAKPGLSWPWPSLTEATRGIRRGEVYYIGAGVKMGKSEVVDTIGTHMMVCHDTPVLFIKPEQLPKDTYKRLIGKAVGKIFHDPNIEFDKDAFLAGADIIRDKAIILDSYQFVNWDSLKNDIQAAVVNDGTKDVIIDPITCFTSELTDSEVNVELRRIAADLALMSKDLDFTGYVFCHLKAPQNGPPHEMGGKVLSSQFAGSRAMMRSCQLMIGLEGNKDPDLPEEERNLRYITVLENRNFGTTAKFPVFWDKNTGLFRELKT